MIMTAGETRNAGVRQFLLARKMDRLYNLGSGVVCFLFFVRSIHHGRVAQD
jgi:hypothetical protein